MVWCGFNEHVFDFSGGDWLAEIIALIVIAMLSTQKIELFLCFYAFCDDIHFQAVRHRDDRCNNGVVASVGDDVAHKGAVILLDEVEKAHPDVFNVLLQVLDDGRMTDGQGRTVDFKNTVIVMTSNLGSQMIQEMSGNDYQVIKQAVMGEVKTYFRPEFINRIDEVVVFHALDQRHIQSIAKIQLQYLEARLAKLEMKLEVSDAALSSISQAGFDPVFGARPLKRAIQTQIENPLAKEILEGKFVAKDTIKVDLSDDTIRFTRVSG